jgi:transcriptional regulator with XRE-family HTH domain
MDATGQKDPGPGTTRPAPRWRSRIREQREAAGFNQRELARRAGLTPEYLNTLERQGRQPGVGTLLRVARALDLGLDDLVEIVEDERS